MEGSYITAGDLALHNQEMRGYAGAYGYGCEHRHRNALQGGSITALAGNGCERCSRTFVSETFLTLAVA